jgi:DNA-binding response OmpR family regulator
MAFTCLLIDDDSDDREIFALALEDAGLSCNYITAKNGVDALTMFNSDPALIPDFTFLDLNMPLLNGKRCLQEIKKISRLHSMPVIMYTTSSHNRDVEETRQLGASHYLVKPSSIHHLSDMLRRIFEKKPLPFFLSEVERISPA